jgi:lysozyme
MTLNAAQLDRDLARDEGVRSKLYQDSLGIASIGIGRNLAAVGLRESEIQFLYQNDRRETLELLDRLLPWWNALPEPAARGLANMAFCLNHKILGFAKMLDALQKRDGERAAAELLDSAFARQTGARAERIAELFRSAF